MNVIIVTPDKIHFTSPHAYILPLWFLLIIFSMPNLWGH